MRKEERPNVILSIALSAFLVIVGFPRMAFSASGCLDILSEPEGADIYIKGRYEGKTPITCLEVPAGKVSIQAKKEGYHIVSKVITVKPDDITSIKIRMNPSRETTGKGQEQRGLDQDVGSLVIFNLLGPVDVYIDGDKKGKGSCAVEDIATGTHDLKVGSFSKQILISKGHKLKVKASKNGIMILNALKKEEPKQVFERDGRFIRYPNSVVKDTETGLEWVAGPDRNTSWNEAKEWVQSLSIDGGGWRMPTMKELEGLYQKGKGDRNMTPLLKTTGWWVWSEEKKGLSSGHFDFYFGPKILDFRLSNYPRAFAVRSR